MNRLQRRKIRQGEIRVDLGEFLPEGKKWWSSPEVDQIIEEITVRLSSVIDGVSVEMPYRTHVHYQVLHVRPTHSIGETMLQMRIGTYLAESGKLNDTRESA